MSLGTPEWIHSGVFRRKGEREIAELGVSSPDTGTDTLAHIPPPARKNAGTGAHGMHLYIDHGIILKCTFIHPHTSTYLYIPHIHEPVWTYTGTQAQIHENRPSPLSQVQPSSVHTNVSTYVICPHKHN